MEGGKCEVVRIADRPTGGVGSEHSVSARSLLLSATLLYFESVVHKCIFLGK